MTEPEGSREFSLTQAGLFFDVCRSNHLTDRRGHFRWVLIVLFAWLPIVVASIIRVIAGKSPDAVAVDPAVHVRLLVAIPILLLAERVLEHRCRGAVRLLHQEQLAPHDVIESILQRARRLRASVGVEGSLALLAFVSGQAALWGVWSPGGLLHGAERASSTSFATFWHASIGLPLVQFLVLRWLWRWIVWIYILVRLARVDLATNALHPDAAAGLKFLGSPIDAFAVFVFANSCVASAAWFAQFEELGRAVRAFLPPFLVFFMFAIVASCGPLFLFSGQIYRARKRDVERYHGFAFEYVREFRRKWITNRSEHMPQPFPSPLGTQDLQSLNDLAGSFQKAERTRAIPFGARPIAAVWIAAFAPMLPLFFSTMSMPDFVRYLAKMLQLPLA